MLKTLGLGELLVAKLFEFALLLRHDAQLLFFKNEHASLLQSFGAENGENGLDLLIEIEQIVIADLAAGVSDLVVLAALVWVEERRRLWRLQ